MRLCFKLNLLAFALLLFFASNITAITTTETSQVTSKENDEHLAPLYSDCDDDPECECKEGAYIVSLHGFYRISSHLTFLENTLRRNATVNWQVAWHDHDKSASYIVKNVTQEELKAIRKDPGVYEIEQSCWSEWDSGWDLECRMPGLSEERERLCYKELDVPYCEKSWLTPEEKEDCLERTVIPFCDIEGLVSTEEQKEYCSEKELTDEQAHQEYEEL